VPPMNCPNCGELDQVQKTSGLISSGTISGTVAGETTGLSTAGHYIALPAHYPITATTGLVGRLKTVERRLASQIPEPAKPTRRLQSSSYARLGGILVALSVGGIFILWSKYQSYCSAADYENQLCDSFNSEEPVGFTVCAIAFLLGLAFLWNALKWRGKHFDRARAEEEYAHRRSAWQAQLQLDRVAFSRLSESAYCYRCDKLFVPGDRSAATLDTFR